MSDVDAETRRGLEALGYVVRVVASADEGARALADVKRGAVRLVFDFTPQHRLRQQLGELEEGGGRSGGDRGAAAMRTVRVRAAVRRAAVDFGGMAVTVRSVARRLVEALRWWTEERGGAREVEPHVYAD